MNIYRKDTFSGGFRVQLRPTAASQNVKVQEGIKEEHGEGEIVNSTFLNEVDGSNPKSQTGVGKAQTFWFKAGVEAQRSFSSKRKDSFVIIENDEKNALGMLTESLDDMMPNDRGIDSQKLAIIPNEDKKSYR